MSLSSIPKHMSAPRWFQNSLAVPYEENFVIVDEALIHYLAWGPPGARGLVFVHGGGAHAHWWTHIAAGFAHDYRVVALDLSGHGDSQYRSSYSLDEWTREVMGVAAHGRIKGEPVVIGHSMGGFVSIVTAATFKEQISGLIICDSPVNAPDPEIGSFQLREAFGKLRTYPSIEDAITHFRTVPEQENYLDYVIDHVARQSLREVENGWQWKFDRRIFEQFGIGLRSAALPYLSQVSCRVALLRSEFGLVTPDIGHSMYEEMGRVAAVIELPEAGHHAMLDQPLVLLTAIRTLLEDWDHSEPKFPITRSPVRSAT